MSEHNSNRQQKIEAHLAIAATAATSSPEGELPTQEELALLLEERLDFNRRNEVLSHLNANHQLYAQWLQLVEAAELCHEPTKVHAADLWQRLRQWLAQPTLQGVMATLLLLLVAWPLFQQDRGEVALTPGVDESPHYASQANAELDRAMLAGSRLARRELEAEVVTAMPASPGRLPIEPPPVAPSKEPLMSLGLQLGEAMVYAQQACRAKDHTGVMPIYRERIRPLLEATGHTLGGEQGNAESICTSIDAELSRLEGK